MTDPATTSPRSLPRWSELPAILGLVGAWLLPLMFVGTSWAANTNYYYHQGQRVENYCWLWAGTGAILVPVASYQLVRQAFALRGRKFASIVGIFSLLVYLALAGLVLYRIESVLPDPGGSMG